MSCIIYYSNCIIPQSNNVQGGAGSLRCGEFNGKALLTFSASSQTLCNSIFCLLLFFVLWKLLSNPMHMVTSFGWCDDKCGDLSIPARVLAKLQNNQLFFCISFSENGILCFLAHSLKGLGQVRWLCISQFRVRV